MQNFKVIVDCRLLSRHPTGINRYTRAFYDFYRKKFGAQNVLALINQNNLNLLAEGEPYLLLHSGPFSLISPIELNWKLRNIEGSLLHSPFYSNSLLKMPRFFQITTVHDLMYEIFPNFFGKSRFRNFVGRLYYRFFIFVAIGNSDLILSVSKTTRDDVRTLFNRDSTIISNGISKNDFPVHPHESTSDAEDFLENEYFLYVGNFRPHKGLSLLLRAYKESASRFPLLIVGTSLSDYELEGGLPDNVVVLSNVDDASLHRLYQRCRAFILPSFYEGFGIPVLEASFWEKPIILSRGGALKEFELPNILFFEPGDTEGLKGRISQITSASPCFEGVREIVMRDFEWDIVLKKFESEVLPEIKF